MMPSSDKMNCHESVRITNETKNGSRSISRYVFFLRPPWKAIQYAMGYATTNVIAVAAPP